jgi:hypothetical protein
MNNSNDLLEKRTEVESLILQRVEEARQDCVAFVDYFLYTYDPKRPPFHLEFHPYEFQKELIRDIIEAIETGNDLFIEKCREMGATYVVLAVVLWMWFYRPGFNALIGSRKEDYVDSTGSTEITNREESLFGKIEYMLRRMPGFMLPKGFDFKKHQTFMSLNNPENGNIISGESSNPNFSRGSRRTVIVMDEFAFWDNDAAAWGATADTTNCRIVLTTPGIKPSKAKRLRKGSDGEKIKVITLDYAKDPRKTKAWLDRERARRSDEDFAREIMINWEGSITGKVYPEVGQATVGDFPFVPGWGLYRTWDFGLDGVAFQLWQFDPASGTPRLVDCYTNSDRPIQWYFPFVGRPINSLFTYNEQELRDIEALKVYRNAVEYGDPDVSKRSLLTGTTTRQELESIGIYIQTKPESNDFASRREKTKVMLQGGFEVNRNPRTDYWLECIQNARYPQRQETSQATTPIVLPIHDWTSHHRTATEYLAVNYEPPRPFESYPDDTNIFTEGGFYGV